MNPDDQKPMLRLVMIVVWMIVAVVAWIYAVLLGIRLLLVAGPSGIPPVIQSLIKNSGMFVLFFGFGIAPVIILCLVGYLGLRGKLLGTRIKRPAPLRGFDVIQAKSETDPLSQPSPLIQTHSSALSAPLR
jgi:hypothetical protein